MSRKKDLWRLKLPRLSLGGVGCGGLGVGVRESERTAKRGGKPCQFHGVQVECPVTAGWEQRQPGTQPWGCDLFGQQETGCPLWEVWLGVDKGSYGSS